jgi:class 3 adenylate cyclase
MLDSFDDPKLLGFIKHTPRVLRHQLISQLVDQYLESDVNTNEGYRDIIEKDCKPSIKRFYASLLFVDISGFTVLSQRLPVDDLKTHINGYFKKILDIVSKYDGEVIKFAGDALFIIWRAKMSNLGKNYR